MKKFIIIFLIIVGVIVVYLGYFGFFMMVAVREMDMGPYTLVYKKHVGDYGKTPAIQNEIYYSLLNNEKIRTTKGFGIYFDDPREVKKENLRSFVGCILEKNDAANAGRLKAAYSLMEYPRSRSVVAEFPFRGKLSIIAGIMKAYPAIERYVKDKGYRQAPVMEIYDVPAKKIVYALPLTTAPAWD